MPILLNHIDRVVANVNNPSNCTFYQVFEDQKNSKREIKFDNLYTCLRFHLNKIATGDKNKEAIRNHIQCYQYRLIDVINVLHYPEHDCVHYEICREKILSPEFEFYLTYLELLLKSFPDYFNTSLPAPLVLSQKNRERFYKAFDTKCILDPKHQRILDLCIVIKKVYDDKAPDFSFYQIGYWEEFLSRFVIVKINNCRKSEKKLLWSLFKFLIEQNVNCEDIYCFIIEEICGDINIIEESSGKIKYLNKIKKKLAQNLVINQQGYNLGIPSLKDMLLNWIKKEINFYKYNYAINKSQTVAEGTKLQPECVNKIKTNLSVGQIGCILRSLVDNKVIDKDCSADFIKLFANNFTSVCSSNISKNSLTNKYYKPDQKSERSTKELFLKLYKSAKN